MSGDGQDQAVGYKKPPKATQFKKGQSGNPMGRKRKQKAKPLLQGPLPTLAALRAEALRLIPVREGENRQEISTIEAVIRSMARSAIQGGVFAQRTFLELQMAEDERQAEKKRKAFEFWRDYTTQARAEIHDALARGRTVPKLLPHPDDIELDYENLAVRILGPANEEEAAQTKRLERVRDLLFEMMLYHEERGSVDDEDIANWRVGFWWLHYVMVERQLPPRLRGLSKEQSDGIRFRIVWPVRRWEAHLRQECEELGIPFIRYRGPFPTWPLHKLGYRR